MTPNKFDYIFVMFEITKRTNHHGAIEHLHYENQLLKERNQLLANENEKLLIEIDSCYRTLSSRQSIKVERMIIEQSILIKKAKQDSNLLFSRIDRKTHKKIQGLVQSYKNMLTHPDTTSPQIYDHLISIITKITNENQENNKVQLKSFINNAQQRLAHRKTAKEHTERYIHLIKQPNIQPQYRQFKDQLNQQKQLYQRIIRKVKRQNVKIHDLENIYEKIGSLINLRWNLRQEQTKMNILEREFQLGSLNPIDQQMCSQSIVELTQDIVNAKKQIQDDLIIHFT